MSKGFSRPVPHEEFIKQKYLSSRDESEEKQKKKRLYKAATKWKKLRILDDDLDLKKMAADELGSDEELQYGTKEDKPVIAAVIDERPLHLKRKDMKSRWITVEGPDVDTRQDSGDCDVGNSISNDNNLQSSLSNDSFDSNSKQKKLVENKEDKDLSPPRHASSSQQKRSIKKSRWETNDENLSSPPSIKSGLSLSELTSKHENVDLSPCRSQRTQLEKRDLSPPRKRSNSRTSHDYLSPPRRRSSSRTRHNDLSPQRKRSSSRTRHNDLSPPRKRSSSRTRHNDLSPPRKRSDIRTRHNDLSPPRRRSGNKWDRSPPRGTSDTKKEIRDISPRISDKELKHSESSKAKHGLCDAKSIREEANKARIRENEMMSSKDASALGKGAKTVYRDKMGKIRDLEKEKEEARQKNEISEEKNSKYKEWSMGLKQREEQKTKAEDAVHEMSKPLARYQDDEDLDKMLREKEQDEDPMLQYMRKKKWKQKLKDANQKGEKILEKPKYNGPTPAPLNRFGIQPGYRWDGVDRSNGFERDYFARISEKTAIREEAYRWSTEDM